MDNIKDFLAFDVETANQHRNSICSIAFVIVRDNVIVKKCQYLVKPMDMNFHQINSNIHGIYAKDVVCAPEFDIIWDEIRLDFESLPIVAHNMAFDLGCLNKTLALYGTLYEPIETFCTYQLTGKKLNIICDEEEIPLIHHDSLSDATACAIIFNGLSNNVKMNKTPNAKSKSNISFWNRERVDSVYLKPDFESADSTSCFFMRKVVITGIFKNFNRNELASKLKSLGADIDTTVTPRTHFLVAGEKLGPSKLEKANKLGIKILSESEFIALINI